METYNILRDLAIIFICAKGAGLLARKCRAPMVVGEIIAGLIIGPCLLNWVTPNDFVAQMAEIGVILIMFSAGLETNLQELKKSGFAAFFIACVGVLVPLVGGSLLYMCIYGFSAFGTDEFFKAVFIGCIMTATSVGITVEVLKEMGKLKTRVGQTILSAAIIDDVIGIIVLTFVLGFKDPDSNTLLVTGKILLFLVLSLVLGIVIYKLFKFYDDRHAHTRRIPIIAITLCFIMAFAAEKYFGIADITGAYIAGIILCNVRDAEYIDRRISINGYMFFAPVFFVSIGLKTDFSNVDSSMIVFSIGFVIVAMLSKVIGCGLASKCFRYSWTDCLKIGAGMMTRGEVALIITNKGLGLGIIDSSYFTAVILLIIVSSIVTPVVLKLLFGKSDKGTKEAALATAKK
ncbi:cation:proton antiporter [Ruminococcus flavefaciens]|uniref:Kef-type K+ transport system membrane component KefB n=1 Tax=Ruminococcus flavefaciens TaxID=1265 RepID=A0A315XWE5_RUMFL|nr:cation:proton antiporter [Ruminococcus flavefaciens]PWJ11598.1 Kef-type K+ transport system membrane component KefB [Ruminococcus flavefaciens]SSA50507.1 Kef-type K+ transport system, membrane component KefB [Ruminococcus flavefaciens]